MADHFHEANRRRWELGAASWAHHADTRGVWKRCHKDPLLAFDAAELNWLTDVAGKRVAVLGSGDNQAVFALAGLGAKVMSVDISEQQLKVARDRAAVLGLQVEFLRADVVDLSGLADGSFDFVYTGGHVAVWVSDLRRYYGEAARILKPGGRLVVGEYHPFRRLWRGSREKLEVGSNYFDRGPYRSVTGADVLYGGPAEVEQFQFHWTVADYIAAVLAAGCELIHVEEFGDACAQWEGAPMAGLPAALLLIGRRDADR
jgi:SAM-dependent methyltransferase